MRTADVAALRAFNRSWSQQLGVLQDRYLDLDRPLAEARLLHEIGSEGADVGDLRSRLALDSGYLSRLLRALERDGLVEVRPRPTDRRARAATLTARGRTTLAEQERRADDIAATVLGGLDDDQRTTLVTNLDRARRLLRLATIEVGVADPDGPPARTCLARYADELRERFPEGYDDTDLLAPRDMAAPRGALVVATEQDRPVGCGAVHRRDDAGVADIRHMWVHPDARGVGLARRILRRLEEEAASRGVHTLRLGTHHVLAEAQTLYRSAGYTELTTTDGSADIGHVHHAFEKRLSAVAS